jgi:hypothetical protein
VKQAIEKWLLLTPECAAKFRPVRCSFIYQLPECGDGAAHASFPLRPGGRYLRRHFFAYQHLPAIFPPGELVHLVRLRSQKIKKTLAGSLNRISPGKYGHGKRQRPQRLHCLLERSDCRTLTNILVEI